jgi:alpha-tubulin suppressor-like RCC1 family protein
MSNGRPESVARSTLSVAVVVAVAAATALLATAGPAGADANEGAPGPPRGAASVITAGGAHTCALLENGTVKCWGNGGDGRLGQGNTSTIGGAPGQMGDNLPAVDLGTDRTATAITAAERHTCALLDDGTVKCWGDNGVGQLGQGNTDTIGDQADEMGDNLPPIDLGTGRTATAISASRFHTCALLDDRTVKCWGAGSGGRLGQGDTDTIGDEPNEMGDNLPPVDLGTGRTATAISAGNVHTCAVLDNGTVKCWGDNAAGQLGQGTTDTIGDEPNQMGDNLPPVDLGTGRTASAITAGSSHTCALLDDGTVKCWGSGSLGKLGQGNTDTIGDQANEMGDDLPPVDLGTGRTAITIAISVNHTCAALDNGTAKCWGFNSDGQLGQGSTADIGVAANQMGEFLPPIDLGAGLTTLAVTTGFSHTCALLDDFTVKCWGWGSSGRLGQGNTDDIGDGIGDSVADTNAIDLGTDNLVVPVIVPADYLPLEPARLLDTRPGGATVDGQFTPGVKLVGGQEIALQATGRGNVPPGADAVVLNVTVNEPDVPGFITAYPCGSPRPNASNLNYVADQTIPNTVISKVGTGGQVCLYSDQTTHLLADVNGAFPAASGYTPLDPARLLDTRPGGTTIDGLFTPGVKLVGGQGIALQVTGRGNVPGDVDAVALNVTVNEPELPGFITAYPCGTPRPNASNLNYIAGQTIPNTVITKVGTGGLVCLYSDQTTHLLADVNGAFPTNSGYTPLDPARLLDTRPGGQTTDDGFRPGVKLVGGQEITLQVTGRGNVPGDADAVVLNVTVNEPELPGFITAYPCGSPRPNASNLNYVAGQTIPNTVITKIGANGQVCLYSDQTTHLLADVNGAF